MTDRSMQLFRAMPDPDVLLTDDELLPLAGRRIRAIWTPGHTPGHLCLHDEDNDVLLTGDHVLPRISPNIGLQPHSATPPLGPYLDSLRTSCPSSIPSRCCPPMNGDSADWTSGSTSCSSITGCGARKSSPC